VSCARRSCACAAAPRQGDLTEPTDDETAELAENKQPHFISRDEQVAYHFSAEILRDHFVSDETFKLALDQFGEQGLVDLIGSLGNFTMLAMLLNAFQVDLQQVDPPFPDVRGYQKA
jgi:4-carboxymuconolactone decarboxylase